MAVNKDGLRILTNLAVSFQRSSILFGAVECGVFDRMEEGWNSLEAIAGEYETEGIRRLADALVALGILEKQKDQYRSPYLLYLKSESPQSLVPFLKMIYGRSVWWWKLQAFLRKRQPPVPENQYNESFLDAMEVRALAVLDDFNQWFSQHIQQPNGSVIDVGGGTGIFLRRFLQQFPGWTGTLLDLPPAVQVARKKVALENLSDRISFIEGDILSLPAIQGGPYDMAFLFAFTHIFSPEENVQILKKVHRALKENGLVLIYDYVMNEERTEPEQGAIFAIQMWLSTPSGNTYTFSEYQEMLTQARFFTPETFRLSGPISLLVSRKKE